MNNLNNLIGKSVVCEKVDAITYKDHPNGINKGYVTGGILKQINPFIYIDTGYVFDSFHSSLVDHIDGNLVYTRNSVYKITELEFPKSNNE